MWEGEGVGREVSAVSVWLIGGGGCVHQPYFIVCVTYLSRKVPSLLGSQELLVDLVGSRRHCSEQVTVPVELCHQQRNHPHWHRTVPLPLPRSHSSSISCC